MVEVLTMLESSGTSRGNTQFNLEELQGLMEDRDIDH